MTLIQLILVIFGAIGHAVFWVSVVNRLHAVAINRRLMDVLTGLCGLAVCLLPLALATAIFWGGSAYQSAAWSYLAFTAAVSVVALVHQLQLNLHSERRNVVL
jgi:hypothetical protein